ncbi:hypothetical protein DEI93_04820 [Curtobacterium sp. MCBD17_035]|uniref:hypothetical protein n=1 Tax=Curtobacterium sp. MCBD17_035 TaxID=2175673 RepID=UPI0021AC3C1D|nr:hypothetical protein [Curtobacterium sp. MCBD17_035]WIB68364.1 hypothetical protein DEI93_04820 [Curtobacterium sp. MCBD17_035]
MPHPGVRGVGPLRVAPGVPPAAAPGVPLAAGPGVPLAATPVVLSAIVTPGSRPRVVPAVSPATEPVPRNTRTVALVVPTSLGAAATATLAA